MVDLARRGFFRGQPRRTPELRPPWALAAALFAERCTRCAACIEACPTHLLVVGDGGFPSPDFQRAECTFCADCVRACTPGALLRQPEAPAWAQLPVLAETCIARQGSECRVCGDHCSERALRFPPRLGGAPLPEVVAAACTGCGACVAPCPVNAVRIQPV